MVAYGQSFFEQIDQLCVNKGKDPFFFRNELTLYIYHSFFSQQNRYFLMLLANPLSRQKETVKTSHTEYYP